MGLLLSTSQGDIGNKNMTHLVSNDGSNRLHSDVILSFEVMTTDVKYTVSRYEHTSTSAPANGIFVDIIPPPEGWIKNIWKRYQTRIQPTSYINPALIDWNDMNRLVVKRTGTTTNVLTETPEGATMFIRNWKYTPGIQDIESFNLNSVPALGTIEGLEGK